MKNNAAQKMVKSNAAAVSVSLPVRSIARPKAEEASRHTPHGEEASLVVLGNPKDFGPSPSPHTPKGVGGGAETTAALDAGEVRGRVILSSTSSGGEDAGQEQNEASDGEGARVSLSANGGEEASGFPVGETELEIVRATTRFALDLRLLSPVQPKGKRQLSTEEKDVRRALEDVAKMATTARNVAMRSLYRRDSEALDGWLTSHGGAWPKKGELPWPKSYSYPLVRATCPTMASGMAATIAREVDGKWNEFRYSVLREQSKSPPFYRVGQPFPVRQQDVQWVWSDAGAVAIVTLYSGVDRATRFRLPIEARDAHQKHLLRMLASGEWKAGQVNIERDRLRPAKWYLRVSANPRRSRSGCATF